MATISYYNPWAYWVGGNTATTVTYSDNSTTGDLVWEAWCDDTSTTVTSLTNYVWARWSDSANNLADRVKLTAARPTETEEERAARIERQRVAAEAAAEQRRVAEEERQAAIAKARTLLNEHLNEEQRATYERDSYFEVVVPGTLRHYRIREGWSHNVERLENGQPVESFCIHPAQVVPNPDNMLAQKLMLEACEKDFLKIANRSVIRQPVAVGR